MSATGIGTELPVVLPMLLLLEVIRGDASVEGVFGNNLRLAFTGELKRSEALKVPSDCTVSKRENEHKTIEQHANTINITFRKLLDTVQ